MGGGDPEGNEGGFLCCWKLDVCCDNRRRRSKRRGRSGEDNSRNCLWGPSLGFIIMMMAFKLQCKGSVIDICVDVEVDVGCGLVEKDEM